MIDVRWLPCTLGRQLHCPAVATPWAGKLIMRYMARWGGFIGRPSFIITIITSETSLLKKTRMDALFHPLTFWTDATIVLQPFSCSLYLSISILANVVDLQHHSGEAVSNYTHKSLSLHTIQPFYCTLRKLSKGSLHTQQLGLLIMWTYWRGLTKGQSKHQKGYLSDHDNGLVRVFQILLTYWD